MILGPHRLTTNQTLVVEQAASQLMCSRLDAFYKYLGDTLRAKQRIGDTDLWHATRAALHKFGATRE
jgi:hypothetical protein